SAERTGAPAGLLRADQGGAAGGPVAAASGTPCGGGLPGRGGRRQRPRPAVDRHPREGAGIVTATATRHDPVDVLVVGAGPGGAIASLVLARKGLKVACLEQGPWFRPEHRPHDKTDWEWQRLTRWSTS